MKLLLENRVLINGLELGLEVAEDCSAAVRSTALVGKVVAIVLRLFTVATPVSFAATFLLDLLGICVGVARLGKVAREVVFWTGGAISETAMVAVVVLLGAGHDGGRDVGDCTSDLVYLGRFWVVT